ncbi:uncharacterized protein LOC115874319 [Sitophilus oryzae]|uniref:Uncharacterized protein LOC115874319 n=1 Tax=Sitophilus oryzae TaxID=7048 RepID=A0A6J2X277_SITOR|nr:uncharacterized protein LOC115874319 [Sitophilus oryzae]XP_030745287.1 uncharacterized protein LOC115874319 [Sitophilus oryzae]XP_030745288.1 uncharacterized protein LOC115874319 [Sitophilus oryzae]XP_030745289.1 uncharacterized protein LOC115874319 [Sitophilus oryzae]XP_030745290.1 uncharacterized protein LOC115874319 [Sitophilus oryzae]XP_030745292.1 uncharacterized protein LOC115874319 [Sitophilus oryzae]XP_030745293.1 uncharacterized protein LOC115874319 [Sitophilus oryzae]
MDFGGQCEDKNTHGLSSEIGLLSLYDTNPRDSELQDVLKEKLGDDAFLEEFANANLSQSTSLPTNFSSLMEKPLVVAFTFQARKISDIPFKKRFSPRYNKEKIFNIRKKKLLMRASKNEDSVMSESSESHLYYSQKRKTLESDTFPLRKKKKFFS